ncbi:DUF1611 domain-containing protein [Neomicrococcus aestuarii]|nr:DUF1611 domain-containing protein [Neomicrococcus aestuarii]
MTSTLMDLSSNAFDGECREPIAPARLARIPKAYTTRFVAESINQDATGYHLLSGDSIKPQAGDVVIARVTEIGKHARLESPVSRRQLLFPGQEIMVAYGNRYAPDQFLAYVPESLEPCSLIAGGGIAGAVKEMHASIDAATSIEPIGLLADEQGVVNLSRFAPLSVDAPSVAAVNAVGSARPRVIAVLGTSMNSGKSTTLGCLVNGLTNAGLNVAAGKATGTGAGNDPNLFHDGGATRVVDFTDFGYPTTFLLDYETVRGLLSSMIQELSAAVDGTAPDVVVIEIADGVYQGETSRLLADPIYASLVDATIFAAADALGAVAGLDVLQRAKVNVAAVSGLVTASPLASAEAQSVLPVQLINTYDLCNAEVAQGIIDDLAVRA